MQAKAKETARMAELVQERTRQEAERVKKQVRRTESGTGSIE